MEKKQNNFLGKSKSILQTLSNLCCVVVLRPTNDDRPLTETERQKLQLLQPYLIANIAFENFPEALFAADCISHDHMMQIKTWSRVFSEKIECLLDIIQRRSYQHYKTFLECLRQSSTEHVAIVLETDGGTLFSTLFV